MAHDKIRTDEMPDKPLPAESATVPVADPPELVNPPATADEYKADPNPLYRKTLAAVEPSNASKADLVQAEATQANP